MESHRVNSIISGRNPPLHCLYTYINCTTHVDGSRDLFYFIFSERAARGGGGALLDFLFLIFFPCSADHERKWPPCKIVFFGLATNALNVRNNI